MHVVGITYSESSPAGRFRVGQYIAPLRHHGIELREYHPGHRLPWPTLEGRFERKLVIAGRWAETLVGKTPGILASRRADATFLSRELVQGMPTLEALLGRPLVVDVDDAVWLASPFGRAATLNAIRHAAAVVVGNDFLAEWYSRHHDRVRVVPTSIDTQRYRPGQHDGSSRFVVGWSGTASNFPYLYAVQNPLRVFLDRHSDAELMVMADTPPQFQSIPETRTRFVRWSPDVEVRTIQEMSVGLMPLPDSEWARGKCAAKMLMYLGCAVPAIVSPIGANADVLACGDLGWAAQRDDDWFAALEEAYSNPTVRSNKGAKGRAVVETRYSVEVSVGKLASLFREVA